VYVFVSIHSFKKSSAMYDVYIYEQLPSSTSKGVMMDTYGTDLLKNWHVLYDSNVFEVFFFTNLCLLYRE